jgi:hypothetical protein
VQARGYLKREEAEWRGRKGEKGRKKGDMSKFGCLNHQIE